MDRLCPLLAAPQAALELLWPWKALNLSGAQALCASGHAKNGFNTERRTLNAHKDLDRATAVLAKQTAKELILAHLLCHLSGFAT